MLADRFHVLGLPGRSRPNRLTDVEDINAGLALPLDPQRHGQYLGHVVAGHRPRPLRTALELFQDLRGSFHRLLIARHADLTVPMRERHAEGIADSTKMLVSGPEQREGERRLVQRDRGFEHVT